MKLTNTILRSLVGGIFIFSGLVKLNDPSGTAYKLEEYFEVFAHDFSSVFQGFAPFSLSIAFFIIIAEVVLGVALIINYRIKIVSWLVLLLIVFFTFLTFYSAYFNKVTDCGCFGDFIKLTPWTSFTKDIVLLVLILPVFLLRNKFKSTDSLKKDYTMAAVCMLNIGLGYYSLAYLPFIDFLPYKAGSNIAANMKAEEAPRFVYIMEKEGKDYEFTAYPSDPSYTYKSYRLENPEKSIPKITDYRIWNDEGDFTEESFKGNKLFILVQNAEKASTTNLSKVVSLLKDLRESGIDTWIITSSSMEDFEEFRHHNQLSAPYFFADGTVLKTMIRANPGLMLVRDGTVVAKWHNNDVPEAEKIFNLLK